MNYLHLCKYIDSDHLCYIYLASYPSIIYALTMKDNHTIISRESLLSSISITFQACAKDLYGRWIDTIYIDTIYVTDMSDFVED